MKFGTWNALGLLAAAAALAGGLNSCSTMEPFKDVGCFGGTILPKIQWEISITPPGRRKGDIDGADAYANRCAKITWLDENGKEVGSEVFQLDSQGDGSLTVPDGAVGMDVAVAECPDAGGGSSGGSTQAPSLSTGGPLQLMAQKPSLKRFIVLRRPIEPPDHQPGASELIYSMHVIANSFEEATAKAYDVAHNGVGSAVPAGVEVLELVEMRHKLNSIQLSASLPSPMIQFQVDVNGGNHTADLGTGNNVIQGTQGLWSTCETEIPLRAFNRGPTSGGELTNRCELRYSGMTPNTQQIEHVMKSTAH